MLEPGSGWLPPLVRTPALAALFWWVVLALGRRILIWLRVSPASFTIWERGLVALAVGAGFIQYLPYTLAVFGWMRPPAVLVALGVLALLLARDLLAVARSLRRALGALSPRRLSVPAATWVGLFALTMGILLIHALVLGPFGSDDDGYHLSAPKRWLEMGTLGYLPTYTNSNAANGFEMLYVFGLAAGDPLGVKVLHYSAGSFAFLGLGLSARRLGSGTAGIVGISALLIAFPPLCDIPFILPLAYVDLGACWMAMTTVLLWSLWREHPDRRLLVCMALCAGFTGTFKLTAMSLAVAWLPVLAFEAHRRGVAPRRTLGVTLTFAVIACLPALPWMLRNWRATGNPVFPMLTGLFPTRDWSPAVGVAFSKMLRYYAWGISAGAGMSEAKRGALIAVTQLLVVLAAAVAMLMFRRVVLRVLVFLAAVMALISAQVAGLLFRYWLPALMCAALAAALAFAEGRRGRRWRPWVAPGLMAVALAVLVKRELGGPIVTELRIAAGLTSFSAAHRDFFPWQMWSAINSGTPADARILIAAFYPTFGACNYGAFWVDRRVYTTDAHAQQFIALDDWPRFLRSIGGAGITHVVISDTMYASGRYGYSFPAGDNEYPFSRRLVDERGERLAQFGPLQLYRLRPNMPRAAAP